MLENVQYNYSVINQVLLLMLKIKHNFYFKSVAKMLCPDNPQFVSQYTSKSSALSKGEPLGAGTPML